MELWFGLIFPIINGVFMLILCPIIFWRWLSQEKRCNILEKGFESARKEAKKSAESLHEMRERIRVKLILLQDRLIGALRDYRAADEATSFSYEVITLIYLAGEITATWDSFDQPEPTWGNQQMMHIIRGLINGNMTTGHLATWRTEIAAAQVWLIQLDGRGRLGQNGGRRQFSDNEIRELAHLKGGMSWIIERVITGNCPFPFGPDIIHELEELIARIEALESAPA